MSRSRGAEADERRQAFVDGLRVTMAERGYDGASVAVVAREAGLAPGLLHYYFPSKRALLIALIADLGTSLHRRVAQRLADARGPAERLRAVVHAALALGDDADPAAVRCWVWAGAEALRHPEVAEAWSRQIDALLDLLTDEFMAASVEEPEAAASALLAALVGCWQLGTAAPGRIPAGRAAATVHRMLDGLLAGEDS